MVGWTSDLSTLMPLLIDKLLMSFSFIEEVQSKTHKVTDTHSDTLNTNSEQYRLTLLFH